jgi:UDP-N-acetylmuramoyl-L-alanyl-D-glutamate--2,6-diaminopimelate ligase
MITRTVSELIKGLSVTEIRGDEGRRISSVCSDSRKACQGSMFIAVTGTQTDGHHYISTAVDNKTSAVVCEKMPGTFAEDVTYICVEGTASALAYIAAAFYGHPADSIKIIGVTGTNGKTTIATLLYRLFRYYGIASGLISTVRNYVDSKMFESTHTTPDPIQLHKLFSKMKESGCRYCFMEVSSHAVIQKRIEGIPFAGAVFTNLTHDHLDYHKTFENYLEAKKRFFDCLSASAFAIVNNDDSSSGKMVADTVARKITYAVGSFADFKAKIMECHIDGTLISINGKDVWSKLIGEFNVLNFLAVYATAVTLGLDEQRALTLMSELNTVEGRFENYTSGGGITAIVDYAHTPDALANVLKTIASFQNRNHIITVVGAGGNRDKTKRPEMARISALMSDKLILTSDNPRNEEPEDIIADMKKGLDEAGLRKTVTITDRVEAIRTATMLAEKGDIILIAGKGHESYQEIKGIRYHFDDRELVKEFLNIL